MMGDFFNYFHMGGYALYVWPAYGIVLGVFLMQLWFAKHQNKRMLRFLKRWIQNI